MSGIVVVCEGVKEVRGRFEGSRPLIAEEELAGVLGWTLRPHGLCRGDVCVPVQERGALLAGGGDTEVDVAGVAAALRLPFVADAAAGIVAVALGGEERRRALEGLEAPDVSLPDLDGGVHLLREIYAMSNVPTVVWIDEDDRMVRPNALAFGTDTFRDFTGVAAGPHLEAVRRWVLDSEVPPWRPRRRGERWPT